MIPVTSSLSYTDGSMTITEKSKLTPKFESYLEESTAPVDVDVCIVDATFLVHVQKHPPLTFSQQAVALLSQFTRMPQQVHLVCDVYNTPSRERRVSDSIVFSFR